MPVEEQVAGAVPSPQQERSDWRVEEHPTRPRHAIATVRSMVFILKPKIPIRLGLVNDEASVILCPTHFL